MPYSPQDLHKKILGKRSEKQVVAYLRKQKFTILHENYKTPFGEADIIARDGDEIAFVEVKARLSDAYGLPREAVHAEKQKRYYKIAQYYALQTGEEPNARFDVAEVYDKKRVEYYKNAF